MCKLLAFCCYVVMATTQEKISNRFFDVNTHFLYIVAMLLLQSYVIWVGPHWHFHCKSFTVTDFCSFILRKECTSGK